MWTRRIRRWLRGTPSPTPSLGDVVRAVAFGDDEADVRRATELAAIAQRERDEAEALKRREAQSAREIARAVKKDGWWTPPSHRGAPWHW